MDDPKCHYFTHDGVKVFYAGCMGGAVWGMSGCTCHKKDRIQMLEDRVRKLEKQLNNGAYRT